MIVTLGTERIRTLDDIRAFPGGSEAADITPHDREAAYAFIERTLVRFRYHFGLSRAEVDASCECPEDRTLHLLPWPDVSSCG